MECIARRVNPDVNEGLWVMLMCPYRFIHCNKGATLVGDIDGRGWCMCGVREYLGTLYFLLNFAVS